MATNGKRGEIQKVDTHTVRFKFPEPYFMLPDVLAGSTDLAGQWSGYRGLGGFAPAHYLKQFHPKYVGQADLDKIVKEAKFDSWVRMFLFKNDWALNPELPVLSPWKTVTPINTPTWTLERNPYSVFVDTAGNQLPYIDRVVLTLAENLEVLNLRAVAGDYDFQQRHINLGKLPVFIENQARGGYKVYLDPGDYGGDMIIKFNLNYDADPEIAKWFNTADFRRALALGIDRDQINETFWLGTGTPSSVVPADNNKYNPGPQYRKMWATLDVKKANEMLDKIGLSKKDAQGYRLRSDGKEPEPRMRELMEKWKKAFGVPEKERIQLGKEVWKIAAEEVYIIGVIGMGPASMGVRVVKTNMGNIPSRQYNSPDGKTPGISRPMTFYWKN